MIIIGEKINGAIPPTAEAIKNRDKNYIIELAKAQEEAGADYLDVCAGTEPHEEYEALSWLIDVVQEVSEVPLCIDSPDPLILEKVFPQVKKPGLLNSLSGEGNKMDILLPILRDQSEWGVIALCCDQNGMAESADDKVQIAASLIEEADRYGVSADRMHIDPLVLALTAVNDSALQFCDAVQRIKERYPTVKVTAAISNISFGMPVRGLINRNFLTMGAIAGLDSAIIDPTNRDIIGTIFAVEALMNRDKFCRKYNNAYRSGKIGKKR